MQGLHNHHFLEGQKCLGSATTARASYQLWSLGGFPGLTEISEHLGQPVRGDRLEGELYEVSSTCLRELDGLESNGRFYERRLVRLEGQTKPAWVYFLLMKPYGHARIHLIGSETGLSWKSYRAQVEARWDAQLKTN